MSSIYLLFIYNLQEKYAYRSRPSRSAMLSNTELKRTPNAELPPDPREEYLFSFTPYLKDESEN